MMRSNILIVVFAALVRGQEITSDTYFYGQSPPVYPSPTGSGTDNWGLAYGKATNFVQQLTIEEKTSLTFGVSVTDNGCAGFIPALPRLGFPGMCFQDAGNGVRDTDFVNGYASGISVGASWNKKLATDRAKFMLGEFRAKGVNVALGPVVGPLGRVVEGGRNWEGFSVDPFLAGVMVSHTVKGGIEAGTITSVKHYIANEQETNRQSISSNLDDKTMHELYLWPFQDAVKAGPGCIMCGYNRVNNSYACGNSKILNGLLKSELGFQGFVLSDWGAQTSGVATALAGLDMAMPISSYWNASLVEAVHNGSIPINRLDDMATRILAAWYYYHQDRDFPGPGVGIPKNILLPHRVVDARNPNASSSIYAGAVEGHVLVKNNNNALPLRKPKLLNIFGNDSKAPDSYDPIDPIGLPIGWNTGYTSVNMTELSDFFISNLTGPVPGIAQFGTIVSGGGSGANAPPYISSPFNAIEYRAYQDGTALFWDFTSQDPSVPPMADACLVFINAFASEAFDRPTIDDEYSNTLITNVADKCMNTVVVIHNAGVRLVDEFVEHPNVTAIIYAHLPGQDSGRAVVSLLYGDENFSGKMPYTVARNASDYDPLLSPSQPEAPFTIFPQSNFSEGAYIDYLRFQKFNVTPRYEFGFGLSYTTYEYENMTVANVGEKNKFPYPTGPIRPGGRIDLWDTLAKVTVVVKNTGAVTGKEIAQLYIERTDGIKWLRGFEKVELQPGQQKTVIFCLSRRDLSDWDVVAQNWKLRGNDIRISVGASSRDLRLQSTLEM